MTINNIYQCILHKQAKLNFELKEAHNLSVSLFDNKYIIRKCLDLSCNIVYLLHSYKKEQKNKQLKLVQKDGEEINYQLCFLEMIKLHQYMNIYIYKIIQHLSKCPVMSQSKKKGYHICECNIFVHYLVQRMFAAYKLFLNFVYEKKLLYIDFNYAYLKCVDNSYRTFKHIYNVVCSHYNVPWNDIENHRQKFVLYMHNTNIKRFDLLKKALINRTLLKE